MDTDARHRWPSRGPRPDRRSTLLLAALLALAAGLRLWRLDQNGFGYLYYAATVRSMLVNWSNFFFVSFDPAGFLSTDKPPIAFWIQAASAWLLGFKGISLLLPQAVEGLAAVALVYYLVRRLFRGWAALLSGLVLAITPVSVAVDRCNIPDSCLVLVLLLAVWALSRAAETGRCGPLLLCATTVGIGFNTKMLVAFGVLPTFVLAYLLGAGLPLRKRLSRLLAAFGVLAIVSASWALIVELTPPERRPFVASTDNNSVLDLVFGHNGLERIFGIGVQRSASTASGFIPGDGRPGMPGFGGPPGPLRLAGKELAEQVMWLSPLVLLGMIAAVVETPLRRPLDPKHVQLLIWSGWFAVYGTIFSFARGVMHTYYLVLLAPPAAALAGIGTAALWRAAHRGGWGTLALCTAFCLTAAWHARLLAERPHWLSWLVPVLVGGASLSAAGLVAAHARKARSAVEQLARASLGLGLSAVLLCPAAWSLLPVLAEGNPMFPVADPALLTGTGALAPPPIDSADLRPLVNYLLSHRTGERYLLATSQLMLAALIIIETGEPVIATGGFLGTDPVLTPSKGADLVAARQLRFVLINPVSPSRFSLELGGAGQQGSPGWRIVSPSLWRPRADRSLARAGSPEGLSTRVRSGLLASHMGQPGIVQRQLQQMQLYDCGPDTDRLAGGHDDTRSGHEAGEASRKVIRIRPQVAVFQPFDVTCISALAVGSARRFGFSLPQCQASAIPRNQRL
jgi:4-amino-4-deoxy-L-arabinose transferase-like glycosyltransferase